MLKLTDDELVALWTDRAEMTTRALEQLQLEMANRKISDSQAEKISEEQAEFARIADLPTNIQFGVNRLGVSFFGGRDRVLVEDGIEEITSTRFVCVAGFPLIPVGTYRVRRPAGNYWRTHSGYAYATKKLSTDWLQVLMFWALALGIFTGLVLAAKITIAIQMR